MRLPPPANPGRMFAISIEGSEASAAAIVRLARVLEAHRTAATWGVATVAVADIVRAAVHAATGHEVALGCNAARCPVERHHLVAGLRDLRRAGNEVSTLFCPAQPAAADLETLVRLGVCMVAVGGASGASGPVTTLRFGLWRIATSWRLPGSGWLCGTWGAARGRRLLDLAIRRNGPFHVMIDAAAMAASSTAERGLERLLRYVDRCRQQGMLSVVTLADISQQLAPRRAGVTAQSILRQRAA